MLGYYRSLTDDSIYHVYQKGFDLYAQCVKCRTREVNLPFVMPANNIKRLLQWKSWELIEDPELIKKFQTIK